MAGNVTRAWLALTAVVCATALVGTVWVVTRRPSHPTPTAGATRSPVFSGRSSTATPTTTSTTSTTTAVGKPPPLAWSPCHGTHMCATLDVPLDYSDPAGPHIGIALEKRPAGGQRIGSLIVNPGGPGESGLLNFAKDLSLLPIRVLADFDVVTFDPRGIGESSPLHCRGDTFSGAVDPVPQTADARATLLAADQAYAQSCLNSNGPLLMDHLGTLDVARDLEAMRLALGDPGLSYLGLSYGTLLGATYAGLFPGHVRAMVLDGALDPSLPTDALANAQAQGFENSLKEFFAWCAGTSACAWRPSGDPGAAYRHLADSVRSHPLAVPGGQVGPAEFYTGTFGTLYARSFWPSLGRALAGVAAGQGSAMWGLYTSYERTGDPSFNGDDNNAVTCLDHPVPRDPSVYPARAAAAAAGAPDFGALFAWGALSCAVWPVPDAYLRPVAPIHAPGSPPILVVGTTQDPATPYPWAESLAAQLQKGVLLTRVGVDHVALFYSGCVRSWVDTYLVSLRPPPPGTVCPQ